MPNQENLTPHRPNDLIGEIKTLIEQGRNQAVAAVNSALTLTYWQVGRRINTELLGGKRAEYGKQVVVVLAEELVTQYGRSFEARNLRRMMQFAEVFPDFEIVSPLVSQLSWTHFTVLMSLPTREARTFYAKHSIEGKWSKRELQNQIERKAFERAETSSPPSFGLSDLVIDFPFNIALRTMLVSGRSIGAGEQHMHFAHPTVRPHTIRENSCPHVLRSFSEVGFVVENLTKKGTTNEHE